MSDMQPNVKELRVMVGEVVREVVRAEIAPVEARVSVLEGLVGQQAQALTTVANVAARAAEDAGRALRAVADAQDANVKMLTSALEQHKTAVAETVKAELGPVLDANDRAEKQRELQIEAFNEVVKLLRHPRNAVIVAVSIAAGGFAYGVLAPLMPKVFAFFGLH